MKRACIIGAGFGGLALAIRLQAAGVATTVVEARDKPGGHAFAWQREGFHFDAGPSLITDAASFQELWLLSGRDMDEDVTLLPVSPFMRLNWPDGTTFDYAADEAGLQREIARLWPGDATGFAELVHYLRGEFAVAQVRLGTRPFLDVAGMLRALPSLAKFQPWRSAHALIARFVKNDKMRQALSFQTMMLGGNPLTTSALQVPFQFAAGDGSVWCAQGGTGGLIAAMIKQFERIGGTLRLHDPVLHVHTLGDRATEVEAASGWRERFDAIASNADMMHSYRDLLHGSPRGAQMARSLAKKRMAPSMFVVHFALEGTWPGIPHHTVLFGPRFKGLLDDIFEHGVLPRDFIISLSHPSVTDPSLAPPGKSTFQAAIPVAHLGKLPIDWEEIGPMIEKRILDEIGRRLIPDIHDRIITKFHYSPRDFALDLNAWRGSAFGLEPVPSQTAWARPHNRDDKFRNFYLVGAGTHPGAGVHGVMAGARITGQLMLDDLAGQNQP